MKAFKIVLLVLLLTGVYAKGAKWHALKSLKEYPASAYTLKEGISYFEIRKYKKYIVEFDKNGKQLWHRLVKDAR